MCFLFSLIPSSGILSGWKNKYVSHRVIEIIIESWIKQEICLEDLATYLIPEGPEDIKVCVVPEWPGQ